MGSRDTYSYPPPTAPTSSSPPPPTPGFRDQTGRKVAAPFPVPPLGPRWLRIWFSAGGRTGERSKGQRPDTLGGPEPGRVLSQTRKFRGTTVSAPGSQARDPPGRDLILNWLRQHRAIAQAGRSFSRSGLSVSLSLCLLRVCLWVCPSLSLLLPP